jgi:hypothetical protein
MTIQFQVESLDSITDEAVKGLYDKGDDGKFTLNIDKYDEHVKKPLLTKNQQLLNENKTFKGYKETAEKFKDFTDEELEQYNEWKASKDNPPPDNKGDVTAQIQAAVKDALAKERKKAGEKETTFSSQISDLQKENRELKIWNPVTIAAAAAGVMPDRVDSLMKLLRADGRFDLSDEGKVFFIDKHGNQTDLKLDKAFAALKDEYGWAFAAQQSGGSGANNNNNQGSNGTDLSKLSATERLKWANQQAAKK